MIPQLSRRSFLRRTGLAAAMAAAPLAAAKRKNARKPNILFVLIDDLGWSDLGCYGSSYHVSPVIDGLAEEGMRFTDAYAAAPVCSPTRASLMTGKYPARLHLTDFIPGHYRPFAKLTVPEIRNRLPLAETSLAELLARADYRCGYFGKWHLGWQKKYGPARQGFHVSGSGPNRKDKRVRSLTDRTLAFMEAEVRAGRPFFAFLSHHSVHIPLEAPEELIARHRKRLKPGQEHPQQANPAYAAMIEYLDGHIGRLLEKLDELGVADETVVIFYSDNGGLKTIFHGRGEIVTSNRPLRDEKGTLYEGGIRVPLIVRWPGRVKPGSTCDTPVTSPDFFATLAEIAGAEVKPGEGPDGTSLMPLLDGRAIDRKAIYFHYPHYHHSTPAGAIRQGRHKLLEFFEDGRLELYDLQADPGETKNLAEALPKVAAALRNKLAAWREEVGAGMPTANPKHDPARAGEWGKRKR